MVLVGAGTVELRATDRLKTPPGPGALPDAPPRTGPEAPLVVVSGSLDLDPTLPLFAENDPGDPAPLVATVSSSPADRRAALEPLAELVVCGETLVDLTGLLATLNDIGAGRCFARVGHTSTTNFRCRPGRRAVRVDFADAGRWRGPRGPGPAGRSQPGRADPPRSAPGAV
ncbi:MAG: hypothetical protein Ct9H300mP31_14210 [Acidimicrobiaceae bacterium]|nr:MAG: hypothetical protein Ct9H300mP31_14210 [Acidimicrobiaceae bacterium]